jgi:RNA polymerase sigma-70 factor (ECF subfamily)
LLPARPPVDVLRAGGQGGLLRSDAVRHLRVPVAADLEAAWHGFRARLRAYVARRIPRASDADDIVQSVFLRLHESLPGLRDADRVPAWLYRTARRAIADHYRSPARRRELPSGGAAELEAMAGSERPPDGPDFHAFVGCVAPMVDALPAPYREAIVLADLREIRVADAARSAGVTLTAMKSRVRRGRQQLQRLLAACCELEAGRAPAARESPEAGCGGSCA